MTSLCRATAIAFVCLLNLLTLTAQTDSSIVAPPRLIRVTVQLGGPVIHKAGPTGVIFSLYADESGGAALWSESQSVRIDEALRISAVLGVNTSEGVPLELFSRGEVRWLGVTVNGREQPRIQLVSVPYALKSKEADTLNGLTAADIVSQARTGAVLQQGTALASSSTTASKDSASNVSSASVTNKVAIQTTATNFVDSTTSPVVNVVQNGTGTALSATSSGSTANTISAINNSATGSVRGVYGETNSTSASTAGVYGLAKATTGTTYGVLGVTNSASGTALNGTATSATGSTIGLRGQANSDNGIGVQAASTATTGTTFGVNAFVQSSTGTAALFDNRAGGKILSLRNNGTEKFFVDGSGNVTNKGTLTSTGVITAPSFAGNGASLTNIDASHLTNGLTLTFPAGGVQNTLVGTSNSIGAGVLGATIAGGGFSGGGNLITDNYGFIGGGYLNQVGDNLGNTGDRESASVVGGVLNKATGIISFIGGGRVNTASGNNSVVVGGDTNVSSGLGSFVGSGYNNQATATFAVVGGGNTNVASYQYTFVGGGYQNQATSNGSAVTSGFQNLASAQAAVVGGGGSNIASGSYSVVPGGFQNTASGTSSFAAGQSANAGPNQFTWGDGATSFSGLGSNSFSALATGGVMFATHVTAGVVDKSVTISGGGNLTAPAFFGDGSNLTNVNTAKISLIPIDSSTPPIVGQALHYTGTAWKASSFVDQHYYPVGTCSDSSMTPLWSTRNLKSPGFFCQASNSFNVLALALGTSFANAAGPEVEYPSDADATNGFVTIKWFATGSGTVSTSLATACSAVGGALVDSPTGGPVDSNLVVNTNVIQTSGAPLPLPADCLPGSTIHIQYGRTDSDTGVTINVIGMSVAFKRMQ